MEGAALIVSLPGFLPGSPVPAAMSSQQQQQQQQCLPQTIQQQQVKQPCQPPPVQCQEMCAPKTKDPCAPQAKKQCPAKDTAIPAQQKCPATSKPPRVNRSKNGRRDTCPPTRLPDAAFSFSCSFSDPQLRDLPSSPIFSYSGSKETLSGFLPMEPLVSYIPLLPVYSSVPNSDSLLDEHE